MGGTNQYYIKEILSLIYRFIYFRNIIAFLLIFVTYLVFKIGIGEFVHSKLYIVTTTIIITIE